MKKLFVIFSLIAFAMLFDVSAQRYPIDNPINTSDVQYEKMDYGTTFSIWTGRSVDTLGVSDTTWSFSVVKPTQKKSFCTLYSEIDTTGAPTGTVTSILEYRTFPSIDSTYIPTDTVVYGLTADTIIRYTTTSSYPSDNWRIRYEGSSGTAKVKFVKTGLKILED